MQLTEAPQGDEDEEKASATKITTKITGVEVAKSQLLKDSSCSLSSEGYETEDNNIAKVMPERVGNA